MLPRKSGLGKAQGEEGRTLTKKAGSYGSLCFVALSH